MADKKAKSNLIEMIFDTREFSGSLIMNLSSKFRNSEWRIQYGGRACKNSQHWDDIWCMGVSGVVDYEFKLRIQKFKMADPIWWTKM